MTLSAHSRNEYTFTPETPEGLAAHWLRPGSSLGWPCLFSLPVWIGPWHKHFGRDSALQITSVCSGDDLIGIAPLMMEEGEACLAGSPDVCDYLDFIAAPGREKEFYTALVDGLRSRGMVRMNLGPLRPDSSVISGLIPVVRALGGTVRLMPEDVTCEMDLPGTWEAYLQALNGKQRHEIRRKLRRLEEAGRIRFRVLEEAAAVQAALGTFVDLFRSNRADKAAFLTGEMASFFCSLAAAAAESRILRLCFLELNGRPVAAVMCFEHNETFFLYNSAYDNRFGELNVGLMSKVLSIREAIRRGCRSYDFLKGDEVYKQRLGGRPVELVRCEVRL